MATATTISKPMNPIVAGQLLALIVGSIGNLFLIYAPGVQKWGPIPTLVWIGAYLVFIAIPAIHNARDAMHQQKYLVPILATCALLWYLILCFAVAYQDLGLVAGDKPVTAPGEFIYFSIVTWTTTGYGDLVPTAASRFFAGLETLCGYMFMGLIIGMIMKAMFWGERSASS